MRFASYIMRTNISLAHFSVCAARAGTAVLTANSQCNRLVALSSALQELSAYIAT